MNNEKNERNYPEICAMSVLSILFIASIIWITAMVF